MVYLSAGSCKLCSKKDKYLSPWQGVTVGWEDDKEEFCDYDSVLDQ